MYSSALDRDEDGRAVMDHPVTVAGIPKVDFHCVRVHVSTIPLLLLTVRGIHSGDEKRLIAHLLLFFFFSGLRRQSERKKKKFKTSFGRLDHPPGSFVGPRLTHRD
jgi:hypothetical protein